MVRSQRWIFGALFCFIAAGSSLAFFDNDPITSVDPDACPAEEGEACGGHDGFTIARELLQVGSGGNPCGCSVHGSCQSNGTCLCDDGWRGQNCTELLDCTGIGGCKHGICVLGGFCECDLGWMGPDCSVGTCVPACGEHGSCDVNTSTCVCDPGWRGRTCKIKTCVGNCTQGNGECVGGECVCYEGFTGPNCAQFVCKGECSGHGTCDADNRRCACFPWYTGEDCSVGLCPFGCSGRGTCDGGECTCDAGWGGAGCQHPLCEQDCSGRGVCVAGSCACQTGYAGVGCEFKTACDPADCSGHGTCMVPLGANGSQSGNSSCSCDAGWAPPACDRFFPGGGVEPLSCLQNCSGHGTCLGNSTCQCDRGWSGEDCAVWEGGMMPVGNDTCPSGCSGRGACVSGLCVCDFGWSGLDCAVQDAVLDCTQNCSTGFGVLVNGTCDCSEPGGPGQCPSNCTGHGACQSGVCACDFGFSGSGCEDMLLVHYVDGNNLDGRCPGNCSSHGTCNNGTCACDPMWVGADCSLMVGGDCPANCTGHGACTANNTCLCDAGWAGIECDQSLDQAGACLFNCTGRGACVNQTICVCDPGFTGMFCELRAPMLEPGSTPVPTDDHNDTTATASCPDQCSGHGACRESGCMCEPMFSGPACERPVVMQCPFNCSGHGSCMDGRCACDRGWSGLDCAQSTECLNNCTGHGACVNATCSCDPGWGEADCSVSTVACPNDCSLHGVCGNGTCLCNIGWRGVDCSLLACPKDCSNHGVCQPDLTCSCDPGWTGPGCDVPDCPNSCSGHGACAQNGTCICYFGWEAEDCSRIADCNKRGERECGFCVCDEGYSGPTCEVDHCQSSRKYAAHDPEGPPIEVCSGHGRCTDSGCECELGYGGDTCERDAHCSVVGGLVCSGNGVCAGGPGRCGGAPDCPDQCVCNQTTLRVFSGPQCATEHCPGPLFPGSDSVQECSGVGTCDSANGICTCNQVAGSLGVGTYTDEDCATPPTPFLSTFHPLAGPLEGGTKITMEGPGMDRLITRNNLATIPTGFNSGFSQAGDGSDLISLRCKFLHCPDTSSPRSACTLLEQTPVSWETTAVRKHPELRGQVLNAGELSFEIGDAVRVYGCNPCGIFGRFVGEVNDNGVVGYLPSNLYLYDSTSRSKLTCTTPSAETIGHALFELDGMTHQYNPTVAPILGANITIPSPSIWFEYFDYESLVRVLPAKVPLRPQGGERGPVDIDRAATITITGSYFPQHGTFQCMFFDPSTQDARCRSDASWVNAGTITCDVPPMRRGKKLVLRTSANRQQFEPAGILFTLFQIVRLDPVCVPMLGVALVTVFGDNLYEEGDALDDAYCRFGIVSRTTGATSNLALSTWYAYHTQAQPSTLNPGALECLAPPAGVELEVSNFALSLDACECGTDQCDTCALQWTPPTGGQNYFLGLWDSTLGIAHDATGLPDVQFHTVVVPAISRIEPSSGVVAGGLPVTFHGRNFTSERCGWGRNAFPSCRFADTLTTNLEFVDASTIVCVAPALPSGIFLLVEASVAIDGQSFVAPGLDFQYHLPFATKLIYPRAGPIQGGTELIITGPETEELAEFSARHGQPIGQYLNYDGLSCVFFMASGSAVKVTATFSSPNQIKCITPPAAFAQIVSVRISSNGNTDPAQLSLGDVSFAFYNTPRINSLENPYGPVQGGWPVTLRGNFFMDLPDLRCRFGTQVTDATFLDVSTVECPLPPSTTTGAVRVGVTMNGIDFSEWPYNFYYYSVVAISPPLGPLTGPTRVSVEVDVGELELLHRYCESVNASVATRFTTEPQCFDLGGFWMQPSFLLGFEGMDHTVIGFLSALRNQIIFDVPDMGLSAPTTAAVALSVGVQRVTLQTFSAVTFFFYSLQVASVGPLPFTTPTPDQDVLAVQLSLGGTDGNAAKCRVYRMDSNDKRLAETLTLRELTETFTVLSTDVWGPVSLQHCTSNLEIDWEFESGCHLGPDSQAWLSMQLFSRGSSHCAADDEGCSWIDVEEGEAWPGWWKELHRCTGAYYRNGQPDCGLGGFCGGQSTKLQAVTIAQPDCPFSSGISADDPACSDALCTDLACSTTVTPPDQCICHEGLEPQIAGSVTSGKYVVSDFLSPEVVRCPVNTSSCMAWTALRIDRTEAQRDIFKVTQMTVKCDSDFKIVEAVPGATPGEVTCPVPLDTGIAGLQIEVSLNDLEWSAPSIIHFVPRTSVSSIEPALALGTGGTRITVRGTNFMDSDALSCYMVSFGGIGYWSVSAEFVSQTEMICAMPDFGIIFTNYQTQSFSLAASLNGRDAGDSAVDGSSEGAALSVYREPEIDRVAPMQGQLAFNHSVTVFASNMCVQANGPTGPCQKLIVTSHYPAGCAATDAGCYSAEFSAELLAVDSQDVLVQVWNSLHPFFPLGVDQDQYEISIDVAIEGTADVIPIPDGNVVTLLNMTLSCEDVCGVMGECTTSGFSFCFCLNLDDPATIPGVYDYNLQPGNAPGPIVNPFVDGFGCDKTPIITQAASVLLGPTAGRTEVRLGARYYDTDGWSKMAGYRMACEFGFNQWVGGAYETVYVLTPVQVLHNDQWFMAETYTLFTSFSSFPAASCGFESNQIRRNTYQCLRCFTPPSPLQPPPDPNSPAPFVTVGVTVSWLNAFVDEYSVVPVQAEGSSINSWPDRAGLFDGVDLQFHYLDMPNIVSAEPASVPMSSALDVTLGLTQAGDVMGNLTTASLFDDTAPSCRFQLCNATDCAPGQPCRCDVVLSDPASCPYGPEGCVTPPDTTELLFSAEGSVVCRLTAESVSVAGVWVPSVTFNGLDWVMGDLDTAITFYQFPVPLHTTAGGSKLYTFGVIPDVDSAEGEYYRLSPVSGGSALVAYFNQQPCDPSNPSDVSCQFQVENSPVALRFSPGMCDGDDTSGCCGPGAETMLTFETFINPNVIQMRGQTPAAELGAYHACFSVDQNFFIPLRFNRPVNLLPVDMQGLSAPAVQPIGHFRFYDLNITGTSLVQGPNYDESDDFRYTISIFGTGFLLPSELEGFVPKLRVDFGSRVQLQQIDSMGVNSTMTVVSSTELRVIVPGNQPLSRRLLQTQQQLTVGIQVSLDNVVLLPPTPIDFTYFLLPTMSGWSPTYGLIEKENLLTIRGSGFIPSMIAKCMFPGSTCSTPDGLEVTPCVRDAVYVSETVFQCRGPSASGGAVDLKFSPFAPESLQAESPELYEQLFNLYPQGQFFFHRPFDTFVLDVNAAPFDDYQNRTMIVDATGQKVTRSADGNPECMPMETIYQEGSLYMDLQNIGLSLEGTSVTMPVDIVKVEDNLAGCAALDGYCSSAVCNPSPKQPTGLNADGEPDCCLLPEYDPVTCCPKVGTEAAQAFFDARGLCKKPNIIKYPTATGIATTVCPTVITWEKPPISICRGGTRSNLFCCDGDDCPPDMNCPLGRCEQMPVHLKLRLATDGGQEPSGPKDSTVLYFRPTNLISGSYPNRVVKDCGESLPGARDCGWGEMAVQPASSTECGLKTFCRPRENIFVDLSVDVVSGVCDNCAPISDGVATASFGDILCRFTAVFDGRAASEAQVPGTFSPGSTNAQVLCKAPVFLDPAEVRLAVALDSYRFEQSPQTTVFIKRPTVHAVVPTNGIYDAVTGITLYGQDFCNDTASLPCNGGSFAGTIDDLQQEQAWCIFDFTMLLPVPDRWQVSRIYSPATVRSSTELSCVSPAIVPETVPARPRALVGLILHGRFVGGALLNKDDTIVSSAYFLYHGRPEAVRLHPQAGAITGGTTVTIVGNGLFSSYPGCADPDGDAQTSLELGLRADQRCGGVGLATSRLFCRFGGAGQVVPATIDVARESSDDPILNRLICVSPPKASNSSNVVPVSISLNGEISEFSNPLDFTYGEQIVTSLQPTRGSGEGGTTLLVRGQNFFDSAQLNCYFTPVVEARVVTPGQDDRLVSNPVATVATFVSENSVTCPLPAAWEFPLACACACGASGGSGICGVSQTRRSVTAFTYNSELSVDGREVYDPQYTNTDVTLDVTDCERRSEALSCQVRVQVGVNLQQRSTEVISVQYEFDMRMPEVHSISPKAGPISGNTVITISGERFPTTGIGQTPPRCSFGAPPMQFFSEATRVSDTIMTCTTPRACILNANGHRGGVGLGGVSSLGMPQNGDLCVFPFEWPAGSGTVYTECAPGPVSQADIAWFDGAELPVGADNDGDSLPDVYGEGFCPTSDYFAQDKQWGECQCNGTDPGPVDFGVTFNLVDVTVSVNEDSRQFAFHPDLQLTHLTPVSGPSTGGSTISVYGSDFSDAGHTLRCLFRDDLGVNVTVLATAVSSTLLRCTAPLKPDEMDPRVSVSVTGNMQQFSEELQFLYYAQPSIVSVTTTETTDLIRTGRVDGAFGVDYMVAAGPVSGGTVVEITGESLVEFSRCSVKQEGYIYLSASTSSTQCLPGDVCTSPDEACTSCPQAINCQIPFNYNNKKYFGCTSDDVQLRFPTAKATDMWCPVNYMIPGEQDFNIDTNGDNLITRNYMMCDCENPVYRRTTYPPCGDISFPGFDPPCPRQGELRVATRIECRFGHQIVPAAVRSLINGTNVIFCVSPPSDFGVRVPLTITLNGADYTALSAPFQSSCLEGNDGACTYFQYLLPAPIPVSITLLPSFTQLLLTFDVPTDLGGSSIGDTDCHRYFTDETMNVLGSPQPRCTWTADKRSLVVSIQGGATFSATQVFEFRSDSLLLHVDNADEMLVPNTPLRSDAYDVIEVDGIVDDDELQLVGAVSSTAFDSLPNLSFPLNFTEHPSIQLSVNLSLFPPPAVKLDAVSLQDICAEEMTVDGRRTTGRYGREFVDVTWRLARLPTDDFNVIAANQIRQQLQTATDANSLLAVVRCVPGDIVDASFPLCKDLIGDFNFSLTVTNWGGMSSTSSIVITRQERDVPMAGFVGEAVQQFYLNDVLHLQGVASVSKCIVNPEVPAVLSYQWAIHSGDASVMAEFADDAVLKGNLDLVVPTHTVAFSTGTPYLFSLTVNQTHDGATSAASRTIEVWFMPSMPHAVIEGGTRTVSQDLDLTMDGSLSYDPDLPVAQRGDTSGLRFCWIMAMDGANCPTTIGAAMNEITLTIEAGKLVFGCAYHIALRVVKPSDPSFGGCEEADGELQDTDFVVITPVEGFPPIIKLRPPTFQSKYNPHEVFGLVADVMSGSESVSGDIEYEWEVQPLDDAGRQELQSATRTALSGMANGIVTLVVSEFTFQPLQTYSVYLHATQEGVTGTAAFELVVNSPPSGGTFNVAPTGGTALRTDFVLDAPNWSDEDMPIAINFGFIDWINNVDVPLSSPQDRVSVTASLPLGDPADENDLSVYCEVTDNLGSVTRALCGQADEVDCKIRIVNFQGQDVTSFERRVEELSAAGDQRQLMAYVAALSITLEDKVVDDATFLSSANGVKQRSVQLMQSQLEKGIITPDVRSQAAAALLGSIPSSGASFAAISTALAIIDALLADTTATLDLATGAALQKGISKLGKGMAELRAARRLLQATDKETQEKLVDQFRMSSIATMRPYLPGDGFAQDYGEHKITMKRFAMTDLAAAAQSVHYIETDPQAVFNIPAGVLSTVINQIYDAQPTKTTPEAVDVFIVSFATNPLFYARPNDFKSYSDVLEIRIIEAAQDGDGTTPADIPITTDNPLSAPLQLITQVTEAPPSDEDPVTGWFSVVVCAYWDSADAWDHTTVNTPAPLSDLGYITCSLPHLSTFGTVIVTAGCDGVVQTNPQSKNRCGVCSDVEQPRTGICDWRGVPCTDGATRELEAWRSCWVCSETKLPYRGAAFGSSNDEHLATRELSGVCNFAGEACADGEEVSVCGLCVAENSRFEFIPVEDDGICDCEAKPNGEAELDRCGICNGMNVSMDECGVAGHIPAEKVCHTQGMDSEDWNRACTGCDGQPQPELPWNPSPQSVNGGYGYGGLRTDRCGVCGGDSSTCSGCDGIPFSPAVLDVCRVCGGNNQTCTGCDDVPRAAQVHEDAEERCGGGHYGAPGCDYSLVNDSQVCSQGCDGIPGSGLRYDQCGICGGDGSSCLGCDLLQLSQRVFDSKRRCGTQAQWYVGCDGLPNSHKVDDKCGVCGGDNECEDTVVCKENEEKDDCGVCNLQGSDQRNAVCAGCDGVAYSGKTFDICGVCDGDGRSCLDTTRCSVIPCDFLAFDDRVPYAARQTFWEQCRVFDQCGVCGGDGVDCNHETKPPSVPLDYRNMFQLVTGILRLDSLDPGEAGWQAAFKAAMQEAGGVQETTQEPYIASVDDVQIEKYCDSNWECVTVDSVLDLGDIPSQIPPPGSFDVFYRVITITPVEVRSELRQTMFIKKFKTEFRAQLQRTDINVQVELKACYDYDICGVWCGDGRSCVACGPCGRNNVTGECIATDGCGKCGGDNSTCLGCDDPLQDQDTNARVFSGLTFDACNVCNGDGQSCLDCSGQIFGDKVRDRCMDCDGNNLKVDTCGCCAADTELCTNEPDSSFCPPRCQGNAASCMGCDGIPHSGKAVDACGECGGSNICKFEIVEVTLDQRASGSRLRSTTWLWLVVSALHLGWASSRLSDSA